MSGVGVLMDACVDALHTLENEVMNGTKFNEPDWVKGTIELLRDAIAAPDEQERKKK
jgi:hypothetical protein